MSRQRISQRDQRALLVGGTVIALALAFALLVRPSWRRRALLTDQLVIERALLLREQAAVNAAGTGAASQARADSLGAIVHARVFAGADDLVATAALVEYVSDLARANDVWMQQITTRPATAADAALRTVRAEWRAEGDIGGLLRLLAALETGPRYVRIDRLDVTGGSTDAEDGTAPLIISASVVGFAATGDAAARKVRPAGTAVALAAAPDTSLSRSISKQVARDLFADTRQGPGTPYRLAARARDDGGTGNTLFTNEAGDATTALPVVLGTAVDASGHGFAMAAVNGGAVVVVRTGDVLGAFTVLSIERARVVFRDAAGRRHLIDATASPDGAAP